MRRALQKVLSDDPLIRAMSYQSVLSAFGEGAFLTGSAVYFTQIVGLSPAQVGLGLTTHGEWVRHVRPAGSGLPPTLEHGILPTTSGARQLVGWLHRHNVDLPG